MAKERAYDSMNKAPEEREYYDNLEMACRDTKTQKRHYAHV